MTLFFAFLIFILCLYLVRGRTAQNRWLFIFRAFFPSWKFFEDATAQYKLYFKEEQQEWRPVIHLISRKKLSLFFNQEVNLCLALDTMVQRLVMDAVEEKFDFNASVSYELVKSLVEEQVRSGVFQFKISNGIQDVLISPEHTKKLC